MDAVGATCRYLRHLLTRPGRYRDQWVRKIERDAPVPRPGDQANFTAVGRVLSDYLFDTGIREVEARDLIHLVRRALNKGPLTEEKLGWFIGAFEMPEADERTLRNLRDGVPSTRIVVGDVPFDEATPLGDPEHRTVMLHEFHYVGPDGRPREHETIHTVESLVPALTCYPYRFDTDAVVIEVVHGGTPGEVKRVLDSPLYSVDIELWAPVPLADTASLRYRLGFSYQQDQDPFFARGVRHRADNVEVRVQFDPARLPARIWRCSWVGFPGLTLVDQVAVSLDGHSAVHSKYDYVEKALVGFRWEW